jgi:transmembrane sensor
MKRPSTPDIETVAADWITRSDAGLTSQEQQVFQDWLARDPRHAEAFDRLFQTWSVFDRVQDSGAISAVLQGLEQRARARRSRRIGLGAAAAAVVLAGLIYLQWPASPVAVGTPQIAPTAPLATAPVPNPVRRLPDGTVVELKAGAEIAVHYEANARRVTLVKGEAFFRVAKDPSRPFFVEAHGVVVRAVGTAFLVQMQPAAVEIFVEEGAVDVGRTVPAANSRDPAAVRVGSGKRFVALVKLHPPLRAPTAPVVEPMPEPEAVTPEEMDRRLAWRDTRLEFNGTTLADAAERLNRQNLTRILIEDEAIGRQRVTGYFRADNPEGFVRMVQDTLGLRAEVREDHTIVLRAGP